MEITTLIGTTVGNKLKSLFETLLDEFGEEVKQIINNNILEYQVEEYNRNYCTKTLLHRVQPRKLLDFYQPLHIVPYKDYSFNRNSISNRIKTESVKDVFKSKQFITIIGNAGSGKSTMVKYLFINAVDAKFKIPIKVELRYLNDYQGNITEYIKEKIFKLQKLANNDRIIERLMSSGDFMFFLDGYDEINSTKKEKITKDIDDLVKLYNKNYYLLTSRPYTEIDLLPLFHNYEVCNLSDGDINEFIQKQIPSEEKELCDKIIEAVNSSQNHSYKSFLSNPLLLSMFILTFQSYSSIPQKRSEFYGQVFDALYSMHDSMSKLAFVREKQSGLSKEQFIEVLKLFSFISYFDETFIYSNLYLNEKLNLIKEKKKNISFINTKLIDDLIVAIGIMNREGNDFSFPHRSLQEYFAAIYITSLDEQNKEMIYTKIIGSLKRRDDFMHYLSRDNFYSLLSELDEKSVIKYIILPLLGDITVSLHSIDTKKYDEVIDLYSLIKSLYDIFETILKNEEIKEINDVFNLEYVKYIETLRSKKKKKKNNNIHEEGREYIAEHHMRPYLKSLINELEKQSISLNNYLIEESRTDTEIISMIN